MANAFHASLMGKDEINKGAHLEWMSKKPKREHRLKEHFEVKPAISEDPIELDRELYIKNTKTLACAVIERAFLDSDRVNMLISCSTKERQIRLEELERESAVHFIFNTLNQFCKDWSLDLNPNYIKKNYCNRRMRKQRVL